MHNGLERTVLYMTRVLAMQESENMAVTTEL